MTEAKGGPKLQVAQDSREPLEANEGFFGHSEGV
jgi:hypothetical protein